MTSNDGHRWSLRPIRPADLEWSYELHKAAMGEYVDRTWGWDEAVQRRIFAERFALQPRQVIQVDAVDAGILLVEERPDELYLDLIELTPAWQGQGLGAEIVRSLLRRAEDSGRWLSLHVLRANPRARSFYEREGLRVVDIEPLRLLMRSCPRRP